MYLVIEFNLVTNRLRIVENDVLSEIAQGKLLTMLDKERVTLLKNPATLHQQADGHYAVIDKTSFGDDILVYEVTTQYISSYFPLWGRAETHVTLQRRYTVTDYSFHTKPRPIQKGRTILDELRDNSRFQSLRQAVDGASESEEEKGDL